MPESKGMRAIFQKKKKKCEKRREKGKIFENLVKNYKTWKYFEKGQVIACDYHTQ